MSNFELARHGAEIHGSDIDIAYLGRMSTRVRRRRGTPTQGAFYRLAPDVKARIDEFSERFEVPTWAIIEAAIRAAEPGPDGIPEGWELPQANTIPMFEVDEDEDGGTPELRTA